MNTYLALGDSYTIGEGCAIFENFPYQTVQLLRKHGKDFGAPEIVAKTGWTSSELAYQIDNTVLRNSYNIVSLLIGVNNQYRGLSTSEFALEFEGLLKKAVSYAGGVCDQVFVLSIPDWSLSPFGREKNKAETAEEIRLYNNIVRKISLLHKTRYVDITSGSPETADNPSLFAADALHPSGEAYSRWAKLLTHKVLSTVR